MKKLEMRENNYRLPFGCQMTKDPMYEDVYVLYISAGTMSDTLVLSARNINHESSMPFGRDMVIGGDVRNGERVYINCTHILKVIPKVMVTVEFKPEGDDNVITDCFLIKADTKLNITNDNELPNEVFM